MFSQIKNTLINIVSPFRGLAFGLLVLLSLVGSVYNITRVNNPASVQAAASSTINFQARLSSASGQVVPDGNYFIEFNLYTAASGGTSVWREIYQGSAYTCAFGSATGATNNKVRVVNGYLTVNLGELCTFPSTINWDQEHWLTMNVGGSGGAALYDGEMTPRLKLTAVPYAFAAGQLRKQTGGANSSGVLEFATLTADRKFILPDTNLATTASPGTVCVFNGAVSNCPAATGSASYIQNTIGGATPQTEANFNIQAYNSGAAGTVGGRIRGAANGQTADLFQLQATDGTILTAFNSSGQLVFGPSGAQDTNLYRSSANILKTDDALDVGSTITSGDALTVSNGTSVGNIAVFSDGATPVVTIADGGSLTVNPSVAAATITVGGTTQTGTITLGQATTAATQLLNIQSANGTASTQTITIGGGTSTTSGGKIVNIANGTPGAGTTNTVAIGNGGTTTGTVGVTLGSIGGAAHTTLIQGGNGASAVSVQAAASGTISVGTTNNNVINLGTAAVAGTITVGGTTQTGTITLGQATTAATQLLNIQSANGTASTQTITIGGGTSTTSGGKIVNIANGTPGAGTTNTVAIGNGGTTTGTVGVTLGSIGGAAHTTLIQGGNGASAVSVQAAASGTISVGTTNNNVINLGTAAVAGTITVGGTTQTGTITLGQATTAATQLLNIQSANGTASTQTITIGGGTSTTSGGKIVNIANGTPGAGTTNTVAIGNGGTTTGTVGVTLGSIGGAAHTTLIQGGNGASAVSIQSATSGTIGIGSSGVANTVQIGNTTGAVTQTINIGNNTTASSTNNVVIGSTIAGTTTLQNAATISLNSPAINSNAATLALFATPTNITLGAAAATFNIGPAAAAAATINIAGGSGATGCTVDGATGNLACSGTITGSGGTGFLGKNVADTSSFAVTAANYLYGFTNSSSAVASGVLNIDNGTNTGNALRVTTAGNPGAGNALIFASNTNASPSGNLLDLQSGSSPTSVFSVNADGLTTSASQITSYYGDSGQIILTRNNPGGEARIVLGNSGQVYITHTNANELSATGSLIIEGASSNLTVQGTGTSNFVGNVDIAGTLKAGTSDAFQVGATGVVNYVAGSTDTAAAVCRNAAGQLAGCNTTGNGAAFIQGGNAFAATAVLGTTDANGLQIITGSGGPNGRAYFDTSNNLFLGNAGTTGLAAAPNAFTIQGTGSSAAAGGAAGGNLTIKAGVGTATGSGSAGGVLALAGGAAQGNGTVARNGGDLTLDGGALIGAGTKGNVILQGSGGNVGIGIATPGAKLDVKGINTSNSILALSVAGSSGTGLQVSNANTVSIGVAPFEHTALRITKDFGALNASFDAAIGIQANVTASANADGTSEVDGVIGNAILAGSNAPAYIIGGAFSGINAATGAGNVPFVYGVTAATSSTGSKSTDDLIAIKASNRLSSSGNATRATGLYVDSPTALSTGRITTNYGIYINTQATAAVTGSAYGIYQLGASDLNYFAGNVGLGDTVPSTKLSLGGTGVSNGITLGDDAASPVNLYRNANDELKTDDAFIVAGLLTGQAGATVSGAAINLNASSNFNTSINTGNSTGTISIGNSASTGFTLENGTGTGVNGVNLFNGATAHTIQLATGAAVQSVTVGSTNTTSSLTLQAGTGLLNIGNDNVAKTTTINIGAEATGADLIALGSSNAGSTLTLLGGTGAAAIQIGNNAASTGIQIGNANGDKDIIIGNSQNSGSTISIEGGTAATGIQIGNSTAAHGIQIGSNATGDNDILLGGANAGSTLILEGGTAANAIQIGNGATAHGIQIGTGAAVQTLVIGSTNTTSATSIQGGVSGAINIGSVGSSTLSSTTNIANTSNATGTQTINLGSSANAANVINLTAGSTGGVKLNTQLAATANSQYLCRDSSTAILTACNTTGNGAAFIQGGNAFAATAVLGTTDANGLQIITGSGGPNGRAYFDTSNNLFFGNADSSGVNTAPTAFSVRGTGSNNVANAGGALTVQGGAGASTTTGSAGGAITIQGGTAGGSNANNGGALSFTGGVASATGVGGAITILTGAGGATSGASGALSLQSGSTTNGNSGLVTLQSGSSTTGTAGNVAIDVGTSSTGTSAINIGTSTNSAAKTISIGGSNGTGIITLGSSSAAQSVLISNGTGASTVSIANATVSGVTLNIAGAANTSANTINIANGASAANTNVSILSGVGTAGASTLLLGNNTRVTQIDLGNIAAAAARTINVGTGSNAVGIDTLNIGTGATSVAGGKTINIGNTAPTGAGTNLISIGSTTNASTTSIQGGTGSTAVNIQAGAGGNINVGTASNNVIAIGTASVAGTITVGGTGTTGQITVGQSTATNTISIGSAAGNTFTQTINIGTSATAGSTTTLNIGSTVAGITTLQSAGGVRITTLGAADTDSYNICRDASTTQLTACDANNATGRAFLNGLNTFSGTATLGTNSTGGGALQFQTNSVARAIFDTSNNLYLGNADSSGVNTAPNAFTISGTGSSAAAGGAAGGNLTIKAGLGTATGTGSAGGVLALAGGAAQGDGTVNRNGGNLTLDGGAKVGAGGTIGNVILQGSGGNVGIGVTPITTAGSGVLQVGAASSTTAGQGISFGGDTVANLYRSAAGTLKTDGAFHIQNDSTTAFQVLEADGGAFFSLDSINNSLRLVSNTGGEIVEISNATGLSVVSDANTAWTNLGANTGAAADILNLYDENDVLVGSITKTGDALFKSSTNSATALRIQQAGAGGTLFTADTSAMKVSITGTTDASLSAGGYLQIGTTAATNLIFDDNEIMARNNGAISNLNLQQDGGGLYVGFSTAATLDINNGQFTVGTTGSVISKNSSDSTTAFQIQRAGAGGNLFRVDTLNSMVSVGSAAPATSLLTVGTNSTTSAAGGISFGTDTSLYRSAANSLNTGGLFTASGNITSYTNGTTYSSLQSSGDVYATGRLDVADLTTEEVNIGAVGTGSKSGIVFGAGGANPVNLYRPSADVLMTDDNLIVTQATTLTQATANTYGLRLMGSVAGSEALTFGANGSNAFIQSWGSRTLEINNQGNPIYFRSATSTGNAVFVGTTADLYESSANTLSTSGTLTAGSYIAAFNGFAAKVTLGDVGSSQAGIFFGSGNDTNLYRSTTDTLTTDSNLIINNTNAAAFKVQSAAAADVMFNIDTNGNSIKVGNNTGTTTATTQFVLDTATTAPSADGAGVNGAMYYDSTLGRVQCYESGSWGSCSTLDQSVTLIPEYSGAVMTGDGSNNTGTMTSDLCSGTTAPRLNLNPTICGATEEHSYYSWTAQATNDYDIYIRYQLPSDFAGFSSTTSLKMFGWRSTATEKVQMSVYNASGDQCGDNPTFVADGNIAYGTTVSTSNAAWTQTSLGGVSGDADCDATAGNMVPGSIMLVRIHMTVGTNNSFARAGAITFDYKSK